jgi:hypothetical protein
MHIQSYHLRPRQPPDGTVPIGLICDEQGLSLAGHCQLVAAVTDGAGRKSCRLSPLAEINAVLSAPS